MEQGRLAAPVRAEQAGDAGSDRERDVVHGDDVAEPARGAVDDDRLGRVGGRRGGGRGWGGGGGAGGGGGGGGGVGGGGGGGGPPRGGGWGRGGFRRGNAGHQ